MKTVRTLIAAVLIMAAICPSDASASYGNQVRAAKKGETAETPVVTTAPAVTAPAIEVKEKEPVELPWLINSENPIDSGYVPDNLTYVSGTEYQMEKTAAEALESLLADAHEAGYPLNICSAYRSYPTQERLHENKIASLRGKYGDRAPDEAAKIVARPGTSEHQTGLAADVAYGVLNFAFGDTDGGVWLAENCYKYGYVVRYGDDKTDITGIVYEPWHIRYVGLEHAAAMYENNFCLEEYIEYLTQAE